MSNSSSRMFTWASIALFMLFFHQGVYSEDNTDLDRIKSIAAKYLAHRDGYKNLDCKYTSRQFLTDNQLSALNCEGKTVGKINCKLLRNGQMVLCENNLKREPIEQARDSAELPFIPRRVLYNGNEGITYSPLLEGGVLYSDRFPPEGLPLTPFDYGGFIQKGGRHPGDILIQNWLNDPVFSHEFSYSEDASLEEPYSDFAVSSTGLIRINHKKSVSENSTENVYFIDPTLGHMPVYCERLANDAVHSRALLLQVKHIAPDKVFPMKSVYFSHGLFSDNSDIVTYAVESNTTKLSVEVEVEESRFILNISESSRYSVFRAPSIENSQFRYYGTKPVTLKDMPDMYRRAIDQSVGNLKP